LVLGLIGAVQAYDERGHLDFLRIGLVVGDERDPSLRLDDAVKRELAGTLKFSDGGFGVRSGEMSE